MRTTGGRVVIGAVVALCGGLLFADPPATKPIARPVLKAVSLCTFGLGGTCETTVNPEGVLNVKLDRFGTQKEAMVILTDENAAKLAAAIEETLALPSYPNEVLDYYAKITIDGETWERWAIDSKFRPLFRALNDCEPKWLWEEEDEEPTTKPAK